MRLGIALFCLVLMTACNQEEKTEIKSIPQGSPKTQQIPQELLIMDTLRTEWQNPDLVIAQLGDLKDKTVLDIGAGAGYFTFKLASKAKKVIALDIDPNALEYIEDQKVVLGDWTNNIEARLTPPDVPNVIQNEADRVLIVNTYPFLPNRTAYLPRLRDGMKKDALLLVIGFKLGNMPVGPSDEVKLRPQQIKAELRIAGFQQINIDTEMLTYQYIVSAKKN